MSTALLLSGAGSRGLIQASQLSAVHDLGLKIDSVYGCSVGALHASLYQQNSMDLMNQIWLGISNSKVYTSDMFNLSRMFSDKACMYDSSPLLDLLRKSINFEAVKANPKPTSIVATNLITHNPEIRLASSFNNSEDYIQFLFASASPPAYFPPVYIDGQPHCDGGICSNFNISQAVADGADTLIVLRPLPLYQTKPTNILEAMGLIIGIATEKYLERELSFVSFVNKVEDPKYKQIKVVYLSHENYGIGLLDFDMKGIDRKAVMKQVYEDTKIALDKAFA